MEKYLIDSFTILHDDRDVIPYMLSSEKGVDYAPHPSGDEMDPSMFEQLTPYQIHYQDDVTRRDIRIYMPKAIRDVTGIMDVMVGQSNLLAAQQGEINRLRELLESAWYMRLWRWISWS